MQKKMDYKAPDLKVIDVAIEDAVCTYSLRYPKGDGSNATHLGIYDSNDPNPVYNNRRYHSTNTEIWN